MDVTDHTDLIHKIAAGIRNGKTPGLGPDLRAAIIEASNTRNAGNREMFQAARAIIDAMPGEFVLTGARQAD